VPVALLLFERRRQRGKVKDIAQDAIGESFEVCVVTRVERVRSPQVGGVRRSASRADSPNENVSDAIDRRRERGRLSTAARYAPVVHLIFVQNENAPIVAG